jgi:NAD(P)H-hydrate epimerase
VIKLYTVAEVRAAEEAAIAAGRPEHELMLEAGTGVGNLIAELSGGRPGNALFLVGPGNNGGDGLVAVAGLVQFGWTCTVWAYKRDGLQGAPVPPNIAGDLTWLSGDDALPSAADEADVIVDAVFGIGSRPELPPEVAAAFDVAWEARVRNGTPLWAIDIPSGVDADTGGAAEQTFRADVTVMIGLPKIGLYKSPAMKYTGTIESLDIGLPEVAAEPSAPALVVQQDARERLPRRRAGTHKREVGTLLVVGGAPEYYGAPRMAGAAALRVGAGLVSLAVPRSLIGPIASALPEVTFIPLPEAEFGAAGLRMAQLVRDVVGSYNALLIGPGLGREELVGEFLGNLFGVRGAGGTIGFGAPPPPENASKERFNGRAVIDADGLYWLASQPDWWESLAEAELVLTPHPGELARLLGRTTEEIVADAWGSVREAAARFKQVVVLKYGHTTVASPDGSLVVAPQTFPSLATAGTGDVLAGVIASLMAQGLPAWDAAVTGVYVGDATAQLAQRDFGTLGLVSSDLIHALPFVMKDLYDPTW